MNRRSQVFTQLLHICTEPLWTVAALQGQDRSEHDEDENSFVICDGGNCHVADPWPCSWLLISKTILEDAVKLFQNFVVIKQELGKILHRFKN